MIYIAGGTSFLGKRVVRKLLAEDMDLRCLFRSEAAKLKLALLQGNLEYKLELAGGDLFSPY